jgi:DNA-binding transcriptional ArsR family regulator
VNLKELTPLKNTPAAALARVDIRSLSEGAAFILLAHRTGAKPKPAQVQAVCRPSRLPSELEPFYLVNVLPAYEFVYADCKVDGKRSRRYVGRMETAAQELATAAAAFDAAGEAVDLRSLAGIIKPRRYKSRPSRTTEETQDLLLAQIVSLTSSLGYPPTIRQVAKELDLSPSTVHRHLAALKESGLVGHNGQRTLRVNTHVKN